MKENKNIVTHSPLEDGDDFFIKDRWNKQYHFKILSFQVPTGLLSVAIEVIPESKINQPRRVDILSDFNADIEKSEFLLKAKIKKQINQRHLKSENGRLEINDNNLLRGQISWSDEIKDTDFETLFLIDGQSITIEKFVEMIRCYEGFNFKFSIHDSTDEAD